MFQKCRPVVIVVDVVVVIVMMGLDRPNHDNITLYELCTADLTDMLCFTTWFHFLHELVRKKP